MLPPPTPGAPDAYAIWLRARSAVTAATYPDRIDYTIAVTARAGNLPVADHYRASCDPGDGSIRVAPISDEQLAHAPPVPSGINAYVSAGIYGAAVVIPVGRQAPSSDLIGVPILAPIYTFGLRYQATPSASAEVPSALPVIATVSSRTTAYQISLLDEPMVGDTPTYHLRLLPLHRPKANRLRELWIGVADYLPRRAVIAGNFTVRPLVDVPWTIDFSVANGLPYITRESTDATLYLPHGRVLDDAVIAFENIEEPRGIYDEPLITPTLNDTTLVEPPNR